METKDSFATSEADSTVYAQSVLPGNHMDKTKSKSTTTGAKRDKADNAQPLPPHQREQNPSKFKPKEEVLVMP